MKLSLSLLGPSLIRRVLLALLLALVAVWFTLAIYGYWQFTRTSERDRSLQLYGQTLLVELGKARSERDAIGVMATASEMFNTGLRDSKVEQSMLLQLNDRQGRQLYLSPESRGVPLALQPQAFYDVVINGAEYRVCLMRAAQWEIRLAAPKFSAQVLLKVLLPEMTIQMLIALPVMSLVIGLVVSGGLRPLRQLSQLIASKDKDDLSPLNFHSPYTELKPLTAALERLLQQLRSKIAREHAFVQDAAHELRTPIAVISAQAHVLARADTPAARQAAGQDLEAAIARASHLIAQLLELSHIDNDRLESSQQIDLADLLQTELARVAPAALARQIELGLNAPDTLPARLDAHAVQSIVQNLLNNAVAYIHAGDQIEVSLSQQGAQLLLEVADSGPGIPPAEQGRIFERFVRGTGHSVAGTGLGLAIVAQAVARLGGQIELGTGLAGRGCRFSVRLPLPAAAPAH
ncbi:HAMP domain-containing sensor histidine kinase [Chitinibacter tainanensis]|uniref:sensor histidine kinase n=1 Tax=Chitinibacter tainanensis TaxID=230667 RepID=UPI0023535F6B|nr:ATP-binding protein [Chitinibacter tainanensis]